MVKLDLVVSGLRGREVKIVAGKPREVFRWPVSATVFHALVLFDYDSRNRSGVRELARGVLKAGARSVVLWGTGSDQLHRIFDAEARTLGLEKGKGIIHTDSIEGPLERAVFFLIEVSRIDKCYLKNGRLEERIAFVLSRESRVPLLRKALRSRNLCREERVQSQ